MIIKLLVSYTNDVKTSYEFTNPSDATREFERLLEQEGSKIKSMKLYYKS